MGDIGAGRIDQYGTAVAAFFARAHRPLHVAHGYTDRGLDDIPAGPRATSEFQRDRRQASASITPNDP